MTKLVIQIPCWNEELNIAHTISLLPRSYVGIDSVEVQIIDDGSSDKTVEKAQKAGADYIVQFPKHRGLAAAFQAGVQAAISRGASIIVNTDADNQYEASEIHRMIQPIVSKKADLVIGDRLSSKLVFLPKWKRTLYFCADLIVSLLVGNHSPDPTSGFRAMSVQFAKEINLRDKHSYTIETLIHAYLTGRRVQFIPIQSRLVNRPSRLIKNTSIYILKSTISLFRSLSIYKIKSKSQSLAQTHSLSKSSEKCLA
jgi:glycosyltransferase involved in cell wall biosynthesis